jgi:hypothetical protein
LITIDNVHSVIKPVIQLVQLQGYSAEDLVQNIIWALEDLGLKVLSSEGTSRIVAKEKYSRRVFKIDYLSTLHHRSKGVFNISEYSLWKAMKDTKMANMLAECFQITEDGLVLTQEYVAKTLPDYQFELDCYKDFNTLCGRLDDSFSFLNNIDGQGVILTDFHIDNIRMKNDYTVKIIDYAALLHTLVVLKKCRPGPCIKAVKKAMEGHTFDCELYYSQQRELVLRQGSRIIRVNKNRYLQEAI